MAKDPAPRAGAVVQKSAGDPREYRHVTLPNGLKALLISDPSDQAFYDDGDDEGDGSMGGNSDDDGDVAMDGADIEGVPAVTTRATVPPVHALVSPVWDRISLDLIYNYL